ncbi:MAG: hypothetical protein A2Y51_01565 [Gallionellales bacterium RIFCSPLOWO2_02_60_31]|nr:MAG: hypothetical protein A2Y51_01565 [Gallionellales bacterium RIFCSPLOWO2_02_60_31]
MNSDLETADHPENLRRVAIDPVSRVEGHGKVTLLLDENDRVHQVRLQSSSFAASKNLSRDGLTGKRR